MLSPKQSDIKVFCFVKNKTNFYLFLNSSAVAFISIKRFLMFFLMQGQRKVILLSNLNNGYARTNFSWVINYQNHNTNGNKVNVKDIESDDVFFQISKNCLQMKKKIIDRKKIMCH